MLWVLPSGKHFIRFAVTIPKKVSYDKKEKNDERTNRSRIAFASYSCVDREEKSWLEMIKPSFATTCWSRGCSIFAADGN